MPRRARALSSTNTYHVVVKGADSKLIFEETKDYMKYLELLQYYKDQLGFELFAYCLMSNHVHLLIRHSDNISLESIFRHINTTYAGWFNCKYDRSGYVQGERYYSEPVETLGYLRNVVRYIHYNPTKAGLESYPGQSYPWSSFSDYLSDSTGLTDTSFILHIFNSMSYFLEFHSNVPDDDCLEIKKTKRRLPDDVAKMCIYEISGCSCSSEFEALSISDRNKYLILLKEKGVSIRQLNRLTGTPRGVIERILHNKNTTNTLDK